ncbi:hypothetical protein KI688_005327 [Linnemannia hyalina]|uniref:F-box domain-containing protein n=1 Tax=Linnemannia hyalina TaxID=64524 RepID=A0A9P8BR00_9FUNG|nr:hypothetical protein KI688_005327 [Linnemannia hyalina]
MVPLAWSIEPKMTGQHNDRFVLSSRTEDKDAIMSSPITTDDETILIASSNISLTTVFTTTPVTKNLVLHQPQHYPHAYQRHQRQGKMYDPTKDLMDTLPPEILDHILFSLDRSTILQCSVLSRRWSRRVMPHLWYRPWMKYYISWMKLLQTVSGARSGGGGRGGSGGSGQEQRDGGMMRIEGTNPQAVAVGLRLTNQEEREKQQQQQQDDDDKEEREDHAGRGRDGIMAQVSLNSREQGEATTPSSFSPTIPTKPPLTPFTYGAFIKILDFSQLHYILSDTFLSYLLHHSPSLQQLIIDSPKQLSDDSLFTLAEHCCNLVRLELLGCVRVSDKGMEAVFERCWKLRTVVLSNVVGSEEVGGDGVGNSSKASSSNHSLTLTHKTIDHLAVTSPPSKNSTTTTIVRKLHTLNLANGLRFPTSGEIDSASSQSLSNLLRTYSTTLVSLNLSFCGLAVTDTVLLQFSSAVQQSLLLPLQHLNIAFCFDVTDIGLVSISEACPDLQVLDITGLTQVSDKSILAIGQGCMKFRQLVMVDERHRSNPGGSVGQEGGGGGGGGGAQWSSQNPLITNDVLNRFPWGVRVVQRRDELLGQRKSPRIF